MEISWDVQWLIPLWEAPVGDHGGYIHQNKFPVQGDEYNYHDSLYAYLMEGISH